MEIRRIRLEDKSAFERFESAMLKDKETNPFVESGKTEDFAAYVTKSDRSEVRQEGQTWSTYTHYFAFLDGEIAGLLSCFWDIDHPDCLELGHLGYMLAPSFRGQGRAGELVSFGLARFREKGATKIYIAMDEDNLVSRKTAEKVGGKFLGIAKIDYRGQELTSAKYEVLL